MMLKHSREPVDGQPIEGNTISLPGDREHLARKKNSEL